MCIRDRKKEGHEKKRCIRCRPKSPRLVSALRSLRDLGNVPESSREPRAASATPFPGGSGPGRTDGRTDGFSKAPPPREDGGSRGARPCAPGALRRPRAERRDPRRPDGLAARICPAVVRAGCRVPPGGRFYRACPLRRLGGDRQGTALVSVSRGRVPGGGRLRRERPAVAGASARDALAGDWTSGAARECRRRRCRRCRLRLAPGGGRAGRLGGSTSTRRWLLLRPRGPTWAASGAGDRVCPAVRPVAPGDLRAFLPCHSVVSRGHALATGTGLSLEGKPVGGATDPAAGTCGGPGRRTRFSPLFPRPAAEVGPGLSLIHI